MLNVRFITVISIVIVLVILGIQLPLCLVGANIYNGTATGIIYFQVIAITWGVIFGLTALCNACAIISLRKVRLEMRAFNDRMHQTYYTLNGRAVS